MERAILFGFSWLRSSIFLAESLLVPAADFVATGRWPRLPFMDLSFFLRARRSLRKLLREDANRIAAGFYPAAVLLPGALDRPALHLRRLPKIFREAVAAARRRAQRKTKVFRSGTAKKDLPDYYLRNFHFQGDGYLSAESAELYDHQVELLFGGAAGAMRRLLLAPLKRHFEGSQGRGLHFLELGCGSGSGTVFLRAAFPEAKITAVDLSEAYLERAKARGLGKKVKFVRAAGEKLPFRAGYFDAVCSIFLFHELPLAVRRQVLSESRRVLKKGGVMAYVDSLQLGDDPGLDPALQRFPVDFHEPFYANYAKHPMEGLLQEAGFQARERGLGFFAKVETAVKVANPPSLN